MDLIGGEGRNGREEDHGDQGGGVSNGRRTNLVRAACWKLWDAKDSCGCATICEGQGGVDEGEGIRVVDEINESKMAGGCT